MFLEGRKERTEWRLAQVAWSALPVEKCLFWAPNVTAEEQPWKVLVGWQLPPMEDLMRQVSTQEFDLFQVQRNSVTRLLPTFLVTLRYSWLKVSVASIARPCLLLGKMLFCTHYISIRENKSSWRLTQFSWGNNNNNKKHKKTQKNEWLKHEYVINNFRCSEERTREEPEELDPMFA